MGMVEEAIDFLLASSAAVKMIELAILVMRGRLSGAATQLPAPLAVQDLVGPDSCPRGAL
jgi:hypothetical protein